MGHCFGGEGVADVSKGRHYWNHYVRYIYLISHFSVWYRCSSFYKQITSKTERRYCTIKCLIWDLLSNISVFIKSRLRTQLSVARGGRFNDYKQPAKPVSPDTNIAKYLHSLGAIFALWVQLDNKALYYKLWILVQLLSCLDSAIPLLNMLHRSLVLTFFSLCRHTASEQSTKLEKKLFVSVTRKGNSKRLCRNDK